ncbi:hypothetical protein L0F63_000719 [Massospora cicadina]|nr:hypothetical protein L0F63_000719 [Massospora cicadina]
MSTPNNVASTPLVTINDPKGIFAQNYLIMLRDFVLNQFDSLNELTALLAAPYSLLPML